MLRRVFTLRHARVVGRSCRSLLANMTLVVAVVIAVASATSDLKASSGGATIQTVTGTGVKGFSGDGGPAPAAQVNDPFGLTRGPDKALYFCDTDNQVIRRIGPDGVISTVAGTPGKKGYAGDGGPALGALLNEPYEIRFDRAGDMVFVEMRNNVVRRVDAKTGVISTIAGNGKPGFAGDGGPATSAQLQQPHSIALDAAGDLFICDIANHRIRRVDARTGVISTFAGTGQRLPTPDGALFATAPLNGPRTIAFDSHGALWLALREGNAVYVLDLATGTLHHVAGAGKGGPAPPSGPAQTAQLSGPKGISIGPDGLVYLADTESHSIRRIDPVKGTIERIAGTGEKGDAPTATPSPAASPVRTASSLTPTARSSSVTARAIAFGSSTLRHAHEFRGPPDEADDGTGKRLGQATAPPGPAISPYWSARSKNQRVRSRIRVAPVPSPAVLEVPERRPPGRAPAARRIASPPTGNLAWNGP